MVAVEVHIGQEPGLWPEAWEEVTDRLLSAPIDPEYGRNDELSTDEAGTCHLLLDNVDGWRDEGVEPNTAVRVREDDGTALFYGVVESGPARWPARGNDAVVDLSLADGLSVLARGDTDLSAPKQLSGARIDGLLDAAGWPAGKRDIDPGVVLVDALELGSHNVLTEIREASRAEDGQIYIAPDGTFVFRDRHARLGLDPEFTFDIVDGVRFADLEPSFDDSKLWPVSRMEMAGGEVFEFVDEVAAAKYGASRVHTVRDLPVPWYEAHGFAGWIVARYGSPRRRFSTFRVDADLDGGAAVRALRPGSLIRIRHQPPAGPEVDELVCVEKVAHSITDARWSAAYELSPYHGEGPWATLGESTVGSGDRIAP